jgi:hypothetical protein
MFFDFWREGKKFHAEDIVPSTILIKIKASS